MPAAPAALSAALDLSVIVPRYNEQENLRELVDRLSAILELFRVRYEIILIEDKSRDDTRAVIRELMAARPAVVGVFHDRNGGISRRVAQRPGGGALTAGRHHGRSDRPLFPRAGLPTVSPTCGRASSS